MKNKYLKGEDTMITLKLIREFDNVSGSKINIKTFFFTILAKNTNNVKGKYLIKTATQS